jgi:hypothetical protein
MVFGASEWADVLLVDPETVSSSLSLGLTFIWAGMSALMALGLIVIRQLAYQWVNNRLVSPDREVYDQAWQSTLGLGTLQSCDLSKQGLSRIGRIARDLKANIKPGACLQRQRRTLQASERAGLLGDKRDEISILAPARDLEVMLSQALVFCTFLRSRVSKWAVLCGARTWAVPIRNLTNPATLVSWTEILAQGSEWRVKWTRPKRSARAQEKLVRAYGGIVSKLVDLCRETLIFDSPVDLANCLELIKSDSQVEVVQVKNRLDTSFDGKWSAGFRYVASSSSSS